MSPDTTHAATLGAGGFTPTTAPTLEAADAARAVVLPPRGGADGSDGPDVSNSAGDGQRPVQGIGALLGPQAAVLAPEAAERATAAFPAPPTAPAKVSSAVFSPLPRDARALRARAASPAGAAGEPDPFAPGAHGRVEEEHPEGQRSRAAGYAAGWAQGVAAAAVAERAALAAHEEAAEAQRDQLRRAFDRALAALDAGAAQMRGRIVPTVDATADVLVAAAADLAEMLLGHELTDSDTRGRRALARALAAAPEHADVTVALHPLDLQLLEHAGVTGASASGRGRTVALAQDASLHPGDAVAHYPGGQVDARVSTAMARLRASLRSAERAAGPDTASRAGDASHAPASEVFSVSSPTADDDGGTA